jgi:CubicO group peptidase (beta-lactamase class C family)
LRPQPQISQLLTGRVEAGDFPSVVYLVAEKGQAIFAEAIGDAVREPEPHRATLDTIYDLASLTKPLVTGLLCARLVQSGKLNINSPIADQLPEFARPDKQSITIEHLLTHTSGLPAWRPLYLLADNKEQVLEAIANQQLEYKVGERVVYSDLGFITLGFLLQRVTGKPIVELAQNEIFASLGLSYTFFNPTQAARTGIAACETGNSYERDMCEHDPGSARSPAAKYTGWRTDVIWGEVHDGNAHFLGGAAGHAGLFSNAGDALLLANQFIVAQSRLLEPKTCELFRRNMTKGLNQARSFAWQLAATKDSTAGASLPGDAFGHTGFTGTSCWIDPAHERIFILLANRTHGHSPPFANINAVRRDFHTLAVKALDSL